MKQLPRQRGRAQVSRRRLKRSAARVRRRDPRQERSRATVEDILEAAAQVFVKLGYAGATTNKIAERAGVSIGSLYQYFANKDDLLRVLLENHHRAVHEVVDAAIEKLADRDIPLADGLRGLLEGLLDIHSKDPDLSRVLAHGMRKPEGRRVGKDDEDAYYVEQVRRILDRRPEVRVDDTSMSAVVVVQTIELLIRWLGHEAPKGLNAKAFVDETLAMLLRYLAGTPLGRSNRPA